MSVLQNQRAKAVFFVLSQLSKIKHDGYHHRRGKDTFMYLQVQQLNTQYHEFTLQYNSQNKS